MTTFTRAPLDAHEERALVRRIQDDPTDHEAVDRLAGAYCRVLRTAVLVADVDTLDDRQALIAGAGELGRLAAAFDVERPVEDRLTHGDLPGTLVAAIERAARWMPAAAMGIAIEGPRRGVAAETLAVGERLGGVEEYEAAEAALALVDEEAVVVLRLAYGLTDDATGELRERAGVPRRVTLNDVAVAAVLDREVEDVARLREAGLERIRQALDVN